MSFRVTNMRQFIIKHNYCYFSHLAQYLPNIISGTTRSNPYCRIKAGVSQTHTNNKVGLGLILGEDLTDEAKEYASKISLHRKRRINHLILIAKQSSYQPSKDQEQTSTIS